MLVIIKLFAFSQGEKDVKRKKRIGFVGNSNIR